MVIKLSLKKSLGTGINEVKFLDSGVQEIRFEDALEADDNTGSLRCSAS